MEQGTNTPDSNVPSKESNSGTSDAISSDFTSQGNKNDELSWVTNEVVVIESISEEDSVNASRSNQDLNSDIVSDSACVTKSSSLLEDDSHESEKAEEPVEKFVRGLESNEDCSFNRECDKNVEEYFTCYDSGHATCNLCFALFMDKNSITELNAHLCGVHKLSLKSCDRIAESAAAIRDKNNEKVVFTEVSNSEKGDCIVDVGKNIPAEITDGNDRIDVNRSIWDYLTKLSNGKTKCNLCNEILPYDTINKLNFIHHFNTGCIFDDLSVCENDAPEMDENVNDQIVTDYNKIDNETASGIWKYFSKTEVPTKLKCNYCSSTLEYTAGVTSDLTKHLKINHQSVYNEIEDFMTELDVLVSEINDANIDNQAIILELDDEDMSNVVSEINKNSNKHFTIIADLESDSLLDIKDLLTRKMVSSKLEKDFIEDVKISQVFSLKGTCENDDDRVARLKSARKKYKHSVLDYFTELQSKDKVKCNFCSKVMTHLKTSTKTLRRHLVFAHGVVFSKQFKVHKLLHGPNNLCKTVEYEIPNKLSTDDISLMNQSTISILNDNSLCRMSEARLKSNDRNLKNKLWLYYKKLHRDKVMCNICDRPLTYKLGQTSNLIKHLIIKHNFSFNKPNKNSSKLVKESIEEHKADGRFKKFIGKIINKPSLIWNFFTKLKGNRADCNLCSHIQVVQYSNRSRSNLIKHLKRKHKYFLDLKYKGNYPPRIYSKRGAFTKNISGNETTDKDNINDVDVNLKMLYDIFTNDEILNRCITYENEQIICKLCSGTFLCDDILNYEYTIRYHLQLCHSDSLLLLPDTEIVDATDSDYNELEAVANEVNSFMK